MTKQEIEQMIGVMRHNLIRAYLSRKNRARKFAAIETVYARFTTL